jgi:hypothetical protein
MQHSSKKYYGGAMLGLAGTLSIHALMFAPILFGGTAPERHRRPDVEGLGATATGEQAEASDAMILLDLSALTPDSEADFADATSSGSQREAQSFRIASPDPLPAFEPIVFDEDLSELAPLPEPASNTAGRALLLSGYMGQIMARVNRAWLRPRTSTDGGRFDCRVRIEQTLEGRVESVELMECNGDSHWQESLVSAIERAAPLSAPPEPSVFSRQIVLSFSAPTYQAGISREDEYAPEPARLAREHL